MQEAQLKLQYLSEICRNQRVIPPCSNGSKWGKTQNNNYEESCHPPAKQPAVKYVHSESTRMITKRICLSSTSSSRSWKNKSLGRLCG